jgi:hypothetical protein
MATLKSGNVTKYDAGGSGDNYIADGFIKTVEKVWIDTYTIGTTTIASSDSIAIGFVPKGKKLTGIVIYTPSLMGAASNCTLFLDTGATMLMTAANTYLGTAQADGVAGGTDTADVNKAQVWRAKGDTIGKEMPKDVYIYAKLMVSGGVATAITGGTIRSIIRYT